MTYGKVSVELGGRGGAVSYSEKGGSLTFWWEYSAEGVSILVPTTAEWDAKCRSGGAHWAEGRRAEVLEAIARQAAEQYTSKAQIRYTYNSIELGFEPPRVD